MKLRIWISVLVILFIGSFLATSSWASVVPSITPEEVKEGFKSVLQVHVTVIWRGDLELEGGGSGFFVADGYVLTCPHIASEFHQLIMDPQTKIEVEVEGKIYQAQIAAVDWRKELMLLKVEGAPPVPVVKLASGVEKRETVFITGYIATPLGGEREPYISAPALIKSIDEKALTKRGSFTWMAMERYGVSKLLTVYGITGQGVSGGPIFDMKGEVVGISWLMKDNYVFATPVDVIREFLKRFIQEDELEE